MQEGVEGVMQVDMGDNPDDRGAADPGRRLAGPAATGGPLTPLFDFGEFDAWNIARAMIQHEDTLIHHRMTHYLSTQAFLFAGMGLSLRQSLLVPASSAASIAWVVLVLLISAMAINLGAKSKEAIDAAVVQILLTRNWWAINSADREHYVSPTNLWKTSTRTFVEDDAPQLSGLSLRYDHGNWFSQLAKDIDENSWNGRFPTITGPRSSGFSFVKFTFIMYVAWCFIAVANLGLFVARLF